MRALLLIASASVVAGLAAHHDGALLGGLGALATLGGCAWADRRAARGWNGDEQSEPGEERGPGPDGPHDFPLAG